MVVWAVYAAEHGEGLLVGHGFVEAEGVFVGDQAFERKFDGGGGERRAVVEEHALAEVEGPGEAVGGGFPLFGKSGDDFDLLFVVGDEGIEDAGDNVHRFGDVGIDRVERAGVFRLGVNQGLAGLLGA